jgi:putative PIN family toxin of toxin-antitoxin system
MQRVVFDTSTLVSAALREGSVPHQALLKAFRFCDLCASEETLGELREVLGRDKFDPYMGLEQRRTFIDLMGRNARLFVVNEQVLDNIQPLCRDSKDNEFLALALVSEADAIVTSDEDLLVLHSWHEVQIIKPAEFLAP